MSDLISSLLLLLGTFLSLLAAVGLIRFPDVYNRIHASGKSLALGLTLILIAGTIFFSVRGEPTLKLLLVIPFLYWTASAGAFVIARAAHRTGPGLAPQTIRDDLAHRAGELTKKE